MLACGELFESAIGRGLQALTCGLVCYKTRLWYLKDIQSGGSRNVTLVVPDLLDLICRHQRKRDLRLGNEFNVEFGLWGKSDTR